jgi:hypothetical protein
MTRLVFTELVFTELVLTELVVTSCEVTKSITMLVEWLSQIGLCPQLNEIQCIGWKAILDVVMLGHRNSVHSCGP